MRLSRLDGENLLHNSLLIIPNELESMYYPTNIIVRVNLQIQAVIYMFRQVMLHFVNTASLYQQHLK